MPLKSQGNTPISDLHSVPTKHSPGQAPCAFAICTNTRNAPHYRHSAPHHTPPQHSEGTQHSTGTAQHTHPHPTQAQHRQRSTTQGVHSTGNATQHTHSTANTQHSQRNTANTAQRTLVLFVCAAYVCVCLVIQTASTFALCLCCLFCVCAVFGEF